MLILEWCNFRISEWKQLQSFFKVHFTPDYMGNLTMTMWTRTRDLLWSHLLLHLLPPNQKTSCVFPLNKDCKTYYVNAVKTLWHVNHKWQCVVIIIFEWVSSTSPLIHVFKIILSKWHSLSKSCPHQALLWR